MKTTSDRLHEIMKEQNLSQADIIRKAEPFAEMYDAKLTRPDLSQYYHGKTIPTQNKLFLLAAALNVSEAWLMGYDVPRTRTTEAERIILQDPVLSAMIKRNPSALSEEYIQKRIKDAINITEDEYELIIAFRKADTVTQNNILKLLDIKIKEKNAEVS